MGNHDEREGSRYSQRPGRSNAKKNYYGGKVDVRLSVEEDGILDSLAERNNVSRSDIIRRALRDFYKFNSDGK